MEETLGRESLDLFQAKQKLLPSPTPLPPALGTVVFPHWEGSPETWDAMAEVMVVGGTSGGESTSFRVLGDRMETGWEHRTLCKGRTKMGTPFPESSRPCSRGIPQTPSKQVTTPTAPGEEEGTQFL